MQMDMRKQQVRICIIVSCADIYNEAKAKEPHVQLVGTARSTSPFLRSVVMYGALTPSTVELDSVCACARWSVCVNGHRQAMIIP